MTGEEFVAWEKDGKLTDPYIIAGHRCFIQGRQYGGFEGKWDGCWLPPIKLFDHVRFGIWTEGAGLKWLDKYYHFEERSHYVEHTKSMAEPPLFIRLRSLTPDEIQGCVLELTITNLGKVRLDVHVFVDVQADLRTKDVDANPGDYSVDFDDAHGAIVTRSSSMPWSVVFGTTTKPIYHHLGDFHDDSIKSGSLARDRGVGKGAPGRSCLEYHVSLRPGQRKRMPVCITGSFVVPEDAIREFDRLGSVLVEVFKEKERVCRDVAFDSTFLKTADADLNKAFLWAKLSLQKLAHWDPAVGFGYFAGLPWFTSYWGRDAGWMLPAVDDIGAFDFSRQALLTLARHQAKSESIHRGHRVLPGEIPNEIRMDGKLTYYSVDSTPLFAIASHHHFMWSGDNRFLDRIYPNVVKAIEWGIKADDNDDGLVEHSGDGKSSTTWMDSYERSGTAVEVQALWYEALSRAIELADVRHDKRRVGRWRSIREKTRRMFDRYWDPERRYLYDRMRPDGTFDGSLTVNAIIPLLFGLTTHDKARDVLSKIEEEFLAPWGVRTRSVTDPEYSGSSYHKGSVWGLTTGWAICAEFAYNKPDRGLSLLKSLIGLTSTDCLGAIPEVVDGDDLVFRGCSLQGWSVSLFIQSIIEYMLGLQPNAYEKRLVVQPCLPTSLGEVTIRGLRIGELITNLSFSKRDDGYTLLIQGDKAYNVTAGFTYPTDARLKHIQVDGDRLSIDDPRFSTSLTRGTRSAHVSFKIKPRKTHRLIIDR